MIGWSGVLPAKLGACDPATHLMGLAGEGGCQPSAEKSCPDSVLVVEFMGNDFETTMIKFARIAEEILAVLEETIYPVVQVLVELSNFGAPWVPI